MAKLPTNHEDVHKDLPAGGKWVTLRGHHIYIKDGKILAGAQATVFPTGYYKPMLQSDIKHHQEKMDAGTKGYPKPELKPSEDGKPAPEMPKGKKVFVGEHNGKKFKRTSASPYTHAVIGVDKETGQPSPFSFHSGEHLAEKAKNGTAAKEWADYYNLDLHHVPVSVEQTPKQAAKAGKDQARAKAKEEAQAHAKANPPQKEAADEAIPVKKDVGGVEVLSAKKSGGGIIMRIKTKDGKERKLRFAGSQESNGKHIDITMNPMRINAKGKEVEGASVGYRIDSNYEREIGKGLPKATYGAELEDYMKDLIKEHHGFTTTKTDNEKQTSKKPASKKASEAKGAVKEDDKKTKKKPILTISGTDNTGSSKRKPTAKPTASTDAGQAKAKPAKPATKQKAEVKEEKPSGRKKSDDNGKSASTSTSTKPGKPARSPAVGDDALGGAKKPRAGGRKPKAESNEGAGKAVPKPTAKPAKPSEAKTPAPAVKPKEAKPKAPKKESGKADKKTTKTTPAVADIRSEAQEGRQTAYDVGDKVGGARKDTFQKNFSDAPTSQNLEALEQVAPEVAQKMCVKKNILPPVDFESEYKNGTEIKAAVLKQLIYDRIAPKPAGDTPEDRKAYLNGITQLHRILTPIKSWENIRSAVSELGSIASAGSGLDSAKRSLANAGKNGNTYTNTEYYQNRIDKGEAAKKILDFEALGEKLNNFFTKGDARVRTFQTIHDKKLDWGTYFKPTDETDASEGRTSTRGAGKKKWERMTVSEHQRTGGKATPVKKPEDMVKHFGMKGVEFGNWVDDASGMFHLKRSAEAFHDLADVLGIDDKHISLNGRLSMAYGARGKAGAAAHYEPERKVINMTKHGGAGSLAHEWGHALDNVMYSYSHGSAGNLSLASDMPTAMGDKDPELKQKYQNLMDAIRKPAPGDSGGTRKIDYDTEKNQPGQYYPEMRRDIEGGMSPQDVITKWADKHQRNFDASMRSLDSMRGRFDSKSLDKRVQKAQRELSANLKSLPHMVAQELRYKQNGRGGAHIKGTFEVPTGQSEYMTRMQEFDGSGKPYYAQGAEMFARVFESLMEDKLTKAGRKNNYLVWDTKTSGGQKDKPFPVGAEREHMHKAMDELLTHIAKNKALEKALEFDLRKAVSGIDYEARLAAMRERRIGEPTKRFAYSVPQTEGVFYIPVNRLNMVYQTDQATNWDKVKENMDKMQAGEHLEPVVIGLDHDVHDGHHRWLAAKALGHTHVPCVIGAVDGMDKAQAEDRYAELWKSFNPSEARDKDGKWTGGGMVYHTTDNPNFIHDPSFSNKQQEMGRGLYVSPGHNLLYWHKALQDDSGNRRKYVIPIDTSKANIVHASDIPDAMKRQRDLIEHYGGDRKRALHAIEGEVPTGDTFGSEPFHIGTMRAWAKAKGYHGIATDDGTEGSQAMLFDDSQVSYHPAMDIDDFISKQRHGLLKSVFGRLALMKGYDPKEKRDADGKWTSGGASHASEDKVTLYHGTKLASADIIQKKGFKAFYSGHQDMGKCVYFKSPQYDKHEPDEFAQTKRTVNSFAEHEDDEGNYAGRVIHATIDKKHVLDCTNGRPKELQDMIDELSWYGTGDKRKKGRPRWDKKSSPYEAYAKKHGIKVIVDKLDTAWEDEGFQIGVYDPKIIEVHDVGKRMKTNDELEKANRTSEAALALIHHEFDKAGNLVLHIGAK